MRVPKFRVYDKVECMMITTSDYEDLSDLFCFLKADADTGYYSEPMQSTGLYTVPLCSELDYERKEIFEGDILKWYYSEGIELEQQGTFVVVFENGAFRPNKGNDITLHEMLEDCDWAKVIGNIYENPELVEEVK